MPIKMAMMTIAEIIMMRESRPNPFLDLIMLHFLFDPSLHGLDVSESFNTTSNADVLLKENKKHRFYASKDPLGRVQSRRISRWTALSWGVDDLAPILRIILFLRSLKNQSKSIRITETSMNGISGSADVTYP